MKNWFSVKADKNRIHLGIYAVIAVIFYFISQSLYQSDFVALLCAASIFCILEFRLFVKKDTPVVLQGFLLLCFAVVIFLVMQLTISCGSLQIGIVKFAMNIFIVAGLLGLFWFITGKLKIAAIIVIVLTEILAIANHLVVQARSFEIQFSDFSSLGTAAGVADKYTFTLSDSTLLGIIFAVFFVLFLLKTKSQKHERTWKVSLLAVACMVLCVITVGVIYSQIGSGVIAYQDKYWKYRGSERNGFFVNMVYSASATRVVVPEGYNSDELVEKTEEFLETHPETQTDKKRPNVIVIMNETFSDVHHITEYFGGEMLTDVPLTPFLDSLDDSSSNVIKGHALASVYGGNTANSELEFLTGLSIQFIPRNTVAYNLYMNENNGFTIVDSFNQAGYETVSIHPEDPVNWQRESIYEYFQFDKSLFKGDFADIPEEDYYRTHVSDGAVYDKIIETYENKDEDTPLFTFAITMQNHSGYGTPGFDFTVDMGEKNNYYSIREYLSCINNSDRAFGELVEYFESQEEETIILFFGDHQPSLSNIAARFYGISDDDPTLKQQGKYIVPYVFWANYDINCERATSLTSINFLSSWLRDMVDIPETSFNKFVDGLNEEVMAINAMGWFDHDYIFYESDYSNPNLSESLELYNWLQYNMLFDDKDKKTEIYTVPEK